MATTASNSPASTHAARRNGLCILLLCLLAGGAMVAAQQQLSANHAEMSKEGMNNPQKEWMVSQLYPAIHAQNLALLAAHRRLLKLQRLDANTLPDSTRGWLTKLANDYRLPLPKAGIDRHWLGQLAERVDMIPADLALAQAASESAWGQSRFARLGNNYFGIWCFTDGCGMIPKRRPAGTHYAVRTYPSIKANVSAYMLNINSHNSYRHLRQLRALLRREQRPLTGKILSRGLGNYSGIGGDYITQLQRLIRHNDLSRYNRLGKRRNL